MQKINGNTVVDGITIGRLCFLNADYEGKLQSYQEGSLREEQEKYQTALKQAREELERLAAARGEDSGGEKEILEAHQLLLEDEALAASVTGYMEQGLGAPEALLKSIADFKAIFDEIDDPYIRERQKDIADVGNRILRKLLGIREFTLEGEDVILYAQDIEPSMMAGLPREKLRAVLLENGSKTSHAVIIARAKGFVTMVGVELTPGLAAEGETVIVDADRGEVILQPTEEQQREYQKRMEMQEQERLYLQERAKLCACTQDGKQMLVAANISSPEDMKQAESQGCQGVGLYRTEFLFMESRELPSEEIQFKAYQSVAEQGKGELCVIRTLDIGGDKHSGCLSLPKEENPFLGFRAIRICLKEQGMFKTQLRAILRAGAYGRVGIMIPMVDTLFEIQETKRLLEEARAELAAEGIPHGTQVPLGIMVETPAAVWMAPVFARYVDFFSIGTNDLVQYTLAADRGNQSVRELYDYFHPAVIRSIYQVVKAAHEAGIWVGMCGEMASDPLALPFLAAIGMDELSMSPAAAPRLKEKIRSLKSTDCELEKLLSLTEPKAVREYLEFIAK